MRWIRTYTGDQHYTLSCGRAVVWDPRHCEPFFLAGFNYRPLLEWLADSAVVIEWDLAISKEDRARFEAHCEAAPDRVHVAPYPHYRFRPEGQDHGWVHRDGDDPEAAGSVAEGAPDCRYFGFGLIYFPLSVVRAFLARSAPGDAVTDVSFSAWHWASTGLRVPVHWDVRPVHLNYDL